jgi:hypothetical protein
MQKSGGEDDPEFSAEELAILASFEQPHRDKATKFAVAVKRRFPGATIVAHDVDRDT